MLIKLKLIFCLYLSLLKISTAQIIVQESSTDHEPFAKAILHVTDRYIDTKTNAVVFMQMCKFCRTLEHNFHDRLMDYVLLNFKSSLSRLLFAAETDDQPWNYNMFVIDSVAAFNHLIKKIPFNMYETNFHILVVFTHTKNMSTAELEADMVQIIVNALDLYVINVVIMIEDKDGIIIFYRSEVFGRDCGNIIKVLPINWFREGKLKHDFLFPPRMRNVDGCSLTIASYEEPPMLIFKGDKNNESHLTDFSLLSGIDGDLIRILGERMNFRLKLIFPQEKGQVFDNGTATGCFTLLNNKTAHMVVGSFGTQNNFRTFFTPSIVYHQSPKLVVVRSGLQYMPLKQLLLPFEYELWNLLICLFLASLGTTAYLRKYATENLNDFIVSPNANRCNAFSLTVTMLGLPLSCLPQRNFARLLILCWIFFTFELRSIYQGKMFDSLRIAHRIPLPRTLDDLKREGYYMISENYYDFYPRNLTWIVKEDYRTRYAMVENAPDSLRIASNSLLDYLAYHNLMNWKTSRLTMVNDPIYLIQFVFYFKKHSRFKYTIDAKLKQLMSAGFVSHITKKYVKQKFWSLNEKNLEVPQISNVMLYGLYVIYGGFTAFALFVFGLEMLSRKFKKLHCLLSK